KKGKENETLRSQVGISIGIGSFNVDGFSAVALDGIVGRDRDRDWDLGADRSARAAGVRAAHLSRSGLSLDPGLLGVEGRRRLLLGPRHMGGCAGGHALDPRLLGLHGRLLWLARWLLGTARWLLRWD